MRSFRHREEGQSIVECAVTVSVLFLLVVGVADFAFLAQGYLEAASAANSGAMYAAQSTSTVDDLEGISTAVANESGGALTCLGTPTVSSSTGTDAYGGRYATVSVYCNVPVPIRVREIPTALPLTGSATQRMRP